MKLGQKVRRTPLSLFQEMKDGKQGRRPMIGKVVYIHPEGRYHLVEFEVWGGTVRECFAGVADELAKYSNRCAAGGWSAP